MARFRVLSIVRNDRGGQVALTQLLEEGEEAIAARISILNPGAALADAEVGDVFLVSLEPFQGE